MCAPCGAAQRKRAAWSGRREGWSSRTYGKGKIREGSSNSKAKAKRKNEAHISRPVYDADDDDDGDAENTHMRTQNEGFSYGVTAALQDSRSATASKSHEPLERDQTARLILSPALMISILHAFRINEYTSRKSMSNQDSKLKHLKVYRQRFDFDKLIIEV